MCLEDCFQEPRHPPTAKCEDLVRTLKTLMWCTLGLGIFKLFIMGFAGFIDLLTCLIIYFAYSQINYCFCMIYIFFTLFTMLSEVVLIGQNLQNGKPFFSESNKKWNIIMILLIVSFLFYAIATYYFFQAYKEFKAVSQDIPGFNLFNFSQLGGGGGQGGLYGGNPYQQNQGGYYGFYDQQQYQQYQPSQQRQQRDEENRYNYNNNSLFFANQPNQQEQQQQQSNIRTLNQQSSPVRVQQNYGGFQAFQGQGRRIG